MSGILSDPPAPCAVRLLVGSQMLLLIQTGLVLKSRAPLEPALRALVLLVALIGLSALVATIIGRRDEEHPVCRWRPRHDR